MSKKIRLKVRGPLSTSKSRMVSLAVIDQFDTSKFDPYFYKVYHKVYEPIVNLMGHIVSMSQFEEA